MAISNTSNPTQVGYTPLGYIDGSQVIIGRDSSVAWEAVGYGSGARPDFLQKFKINLSYQQDITQPLSDSNPLETNTFISLDITDLLEAYNANPDNFPTQLNLTFKEASVCEIPEGETEARERRMIIIGSQTYDPPPES